MDFSPFYNVHNNITMNRRALGPSWSQQEVDSCQSENNTAEWYNLRNWDLEFCIVVGHKKRIHLGGHMWI